MLFDDTTMTPPAEGDQPAAPAPSEGGDMGGGDMGGGDMGGGESTEGGEDTAA